mgnify:CR=1 FL=1|jgi:hypothetical protein
MCQQMQGGKDMTDVGSRIGQAFERISVGILLAAAAAGGAYADELPMFRKGIWEFSRTIESGAGKSQTMTSRKCVSPTDDMRAQNARLAKSGCTFSPYARSANQYTMSAKCHVMGISSDTTTVVSVESDSAYRVTVAGVTDGAKTKEVMIARRVGDC